MFILHNSSDSLHVYMQGVLSSMVVQPADRGSAAQGAQCGFAKVVSHVQKDDQREGSGLVLDQIGGIHEVHQYHYWFVMSITYTY